MVAGTSVKTYFCRSCSESHAIYKALALPPAAQLTSSYQAKKEIKHVSGSACSPLNSVFVGQHSYRGAYTLAAGSGSLEIDLGRQGTPEAIVFYGDATDSIREEYGTITGFFDAFKIVLPGFSDKVHLVGTGSLEIQHEKCANCSALIWG